MSKPKDELTANHVYWVASYGNGGMDVQFYKDPLTYGRAVNDVRRRHDTGGWDIDSYTHGKVTDRDLL